MTEPVPPAERRRPGRPATGVTPKRQIRIGAVWDRVEALAKRATGENMPAVVTRLLATEERRLQRKAAPTEDA